MPSPFPGMDPFFERPDIWPGVHHHLITLITIALNARIPPPLLAVTEERVNIELPRRDYRPDISVRRNTSRTNQATAVATLDRPELATDPPLVFEIEPVEERQGYIEIRVLGGPDDGRLITAIELLSHANKTDRGGGRTAYIQKQDHLLHGDAHLMEIDLLRAGQHTVAVPDSFLRAENPGYQYAVSLHRADDIWRYSAWAWSVRERLPVVPVPLTPELGSVPLDLQAVFTRFYDETGYARRVNYEDPIDPPLSGEEEAWADEILRARGLR
jgi:hypothetical protein